MLFLHIWRMTDLHDVVAGHMFYDNDFLKHMIKYATGSVK